MAEGALNEAPLFDQLDRKAPQFAARPFGLVTWNRGDFDRVE